jgi:hypothetical protein
MKEYICKEVQTDNGGYLEIEKELILCEDCKYWSGDGYFCDYDMIAFKNDYCSRAIPKKSTQVDHD